MEKEIIENEVEIKEEETTTELEEETGGLSNVVIGIGVAGIVGALAYKFIAKPLLSKYKDKKAASKVVFVDEDEVEHCTGTVEDTEK